MLESKVFSGIKVSSSAESPDVIHLLHQLHSYPHITSARLLIRTGDMTLSPSFVDYMESSYTRRQLHLSLGSVPLRHDLDGWCKAVCASLSRSKSIRKLHVTSMWMNEQEVHFLTYAVTSSHSTEKVHYSTITFTNSAAFVHRLSLGIKTNYTLFDVTIDTLVDRESANHLFLVCDMTRRNSGLVALAVQLVTGGQPRRQVLPEIFRRYQSLIFTVCNNENNQECC
ncbi:hypothetical protein HPB51_000530 [Rhipicephalus microplus]|uniref:Uncharacterized protein n=1 Tax=Rhipicephalus microplus TaxID=6941 RepID=A0A9J6D3M2_RHIMP|nr:hypothetical protein HPB51_000530 [Rhipicephalus microplus]